MSSAVFTMYGRQSFIYAILHGSQVMSFLFFFGFVKI